MDNSSKVLLLLGTTGSGKSALLEELSRSIDFELVSADSIQVYRGLDIGSAKPSMSEREAFTHHLIDIRDFYEAYSVGEFYHDAINAVRNIERRGKLPVVSGGTVFYIKNFLFGLSLTPESNPEVRQNLMAEKNLLGLDVLYERVKGIDPEYAKKLSSHDEQRIIRALEIYETTGKKVTDFSLSCTIREGLDARIFAIDESKENNDRNIEKRIDKMFELGLEDEVASLKAQGATADMQSMKGIGYREFFDENNQSREEIKAAILKDTKQYAKRQRTFLRSLPCVRYENKSNMVNAILTDVKGWT